jgi:HEPN superfamily AbiU2-like protein
MAAKEELKKHLDAIVDDILAADHCYFLMLGIGGNAGAVNAKNFGDLFSFQQEALLSVFTLSTARLFELPPRKYKIRGIPATLDFLEEHKNGIAIDNREMLASYLGLKGIEGLTDTQFTAVAIADIRGRLPHVEGAPLFDALDAIRFRRDKQIAHNEIVEADQMPELTFRQALNVLDLARTIVAALGGYFNVSYMMEDEGGRYYILQRDAKRIAVALQRLFEDAGLAERPFPLPRG